MPAALPHTRPVQMASLPTPPLVAARPSSRPGSLHGGAAAASARTSASGAKEGAAAGWSTLSVVRSAELARAHLAALPPTSPPPVRWSPFADCLPL